MNIKINTICFILLFFLIIGAASAADNVNETLESINQPDHQAIDNVDEDRLEASNNEEVVSKIIESDDAQIGDNSNGILSKTIEDKDIVGASKQAKESLVAYILPANAKMKITMKASNVKMHYKDGSKFKVTLKDPFKKVMKNTKVKITINGKTYTPKTDKKGVASISLNLKSGKYSVVSTYDGSSSYAKQSIKNTVTIKSTVKCSDLSKYYKNKSKYHSTFYDKKGKLLKNTKVKFKLNSKTYSVKTNKKGVASLDINLKPGTYSISSVNPKTSETVSKKITIHSLIQTSDLTMNENDKSKFTVKVFNSNGKVSANKKVTLKVNGKTYTPKSNSQGIATQVIDLKAGKYTITTEYEGLKSTNQITVKKVNVPEPVKKTEILHTTLIPNYVNVTTPYVFQNSVYSLKTGFDGIIKMPKNDLITVQISETKGYTFSHAPIEGMDAIVIGGKTHLVPFDGSGVKSDYNRANLKGDGILISNTFNYTNIEYRSSTETNTDLFGLYIDKGLQNSETITYLQNNRITAKVNFLTYNYDEMGLKYSLSKFYGKTIYDFNYKSYDEITNNNAQSIKFANTGEPVTFSYFGNSIFGPQSKENIVTKLSINGKEELEKDEVISYGLGEKYRSTVGFEVLQSYAVLNERVSRNILENWVNKNPSYLNKFGIMNVYGMFLASLETAWLADEIADKNAKELNVNWKRENTATILGGINLDDTYVHILNADMGMKVNGAEENNILFRLVNSMYLPNIEDYVLSPIADRYSDNSSNSLINVFTSITNKTFSVAQINDMLFLFSEDDTNSAIIMNTTTGVTNVIMENENNVYKGANVKTVNDCCSICNIPKDIINGIKNTAKLLFPGITVLMDHINIVYPLTVVAYKIGAFMLSKKLLEVTGSKVAAYSLFTTMVFLQDGGSYVKDNMIDTKDWHTVMDGITFTRPGYLQGKKVYNIPNKKGSYDYIEIPIKGDYKLDRDNALYISSGKTKKLTKEETYQYFSEDYYSPFAVPFKYWNKSFK